MANGKVSVLMADQNQDVIDIPSLHIVGCSDPYVAGAVALYNMCDRDCAELFDHGKGHTVPRDARTIQELCDSIERVISTSSSSSTGFEGPGLGSQKLGLKTLGSLTV